MKILSFNLRSFALFACAIASAGCQFFAATTTDQRTRGGASPSDNKARNKPDAQQSYAAPKQIATLEDKDIKESSGIVASRLNENIFWTHNDSGDQPLIYAFDRAGKKRGVWKLTGARSTDWEDIAASPPDAAGNSYLYLGDIGGGKKIRRERVTIYRVREPKVTDANRQSTKKTATATERAETIEVKYPDGSHDAETLLVHPQTGDLYIITKGMFSSSVYKLKAPITSGAVHMLTKIGSLKSDSFFGGLMTGGDISPDGTRIVLCDYANAYEIRLAQNSRSFDDIWKQELIEIKAGERRQGEAVCHSLDGEAILLTSEKRPTPLIEVIRVLK